MVHGMVTIVQNTVLEIHYHFKTNIPVDYTNVGRYADRAFLSHDQLFYYFQNIHFLMNRFLNPYSMNLESENIG